ncbi:MAG: SPFH domain-containing protein [Lachnospiraceae bacterium]|nr:SPFH domain-containing protein [Lachnospiraceae bacterium]
MGLLKTAIDAVGAQAKSAGANMFTNILGSGSTAVADQYLEYFYCDAFGEGVLAVKGKNRLAKGNNKGSDNIISNGSIIEVNAGQAALIIDDGKVAEFCAEPGQYRYDQSTQPSIFYGNLGKNILDTFAEIGKRFAFGGELSKTQRVYYVNIIEVRNNLWGTSNPIPFFIADQVTGFQGDISLIANGEYTFHISDPIRFYSFIAANFSGETYNKKELQSIMRSDFMTALQPALGALSDYGVGLRYSAITTKTDILVEKLNEKLSDKWGKLRGMEVIDVTFNTLKATEEDEARIKQFQDTAVMMNDEMKKARMTTAWANGIENAGGNEGGAMMAFAGLNLAGNMMNQGGMGGSIFGNGQGGAPQVAVAQAAAPVNGWKCSCGKDGNTGKFCAECGAKKPDNAGWTCSCGAVNQGKFCSSCGAKKPEGAPLYKCDKCGWEPEDPMNPPKFCPECGDIFDENDIK